MSDRNILLPDDLLSNTPKASQGNDVAKVSLEFLDVVKDQAVSESSMPLSPQWLYSKHSDPKQQDIRGPNSLSLGNSTDLTQKESDKKDWRKLASENESARRWREEERETGLLVRKDRRKPERRVETASVRDNLEARSLPSSERWNDANNRNAAHETKPVSKWSTRWGPEDKEKEKEQRIEKKTDVEKEESHNDAQSIGITNHEADTRDKWRPRHRIESSAGAPSPYRAAPGFGPAKGKVDGPTTGFTVGRGRSSTTLHSRPVLGSPSGTLQDNKNENILGKPSLSADSFCYPRAKLLDIYRLQKIDPTFATKPPSMDEVPGVTQVVFVEPLAFVAPDDVEEGILNDMWKGMITGSAASDNPSIQNKMLAAATGLGDVECIAGALPPSITEDVNAYYHDRAINDSCQSEETSAKYDEEVTASSKRFERLQAGDADKFDAVNYNDSLFKAAENWQSMDSSSITHHIFGDNETFSVNVGSKLPGETNTLVAPQAIEGSGGRLEGASPEELMLYYRDPQGEIQGPFLGVDIISWFEQGFFGIDLPVRLADASEDVPFHELGDVMPHLKVQEGHVFSSDSSARMDSLGGSAATTDFNDLSTLNNQSWPFSEFDNQTNQQGHSTMSEHDMPSQLPFLEAKSFHDASAIDEEIVFPGRPGSGGNHAGRRLRSADGPSTNATGYPFNSNERKEFGLPTQNNDKLHPFGLLWSELESNPSGQNQSLSMPSAVDMPSHIMGQSASSFGGVHDPNIEETWPNYSDKGLVPNSNIFGELLEGPQFSHIEQEPDHRELAEHLMSQQLHQQRIQQRNMLSQFGNLNESPVDQVSARNSVHQLANQPFSELDHFLALQQQRQLELQQQQQQQLQEQQRQQQLQQIYMQERESQANQFLLEQIMHGSACDPGFPQSHMDSGMGNNVLEQMMLKQHLLRESQMHLHQPSRHSDPFVEQLIRAKMGQGAHQADLLERMQQARHEELMLQQEQLQARQMQMGLRRRQEMGEGRPMGSVWSLDESESYLRDHGGPRRAHSAAFSPPAFSPLDIFQQQQRVSHDEQIREIERLQLQDQVKRGLYDGTIPFERALSLQGGGSGINLDMANAMTRFQDMDIQDPSSRIRSAGHLGSLSSGTHPHHPHHPFISNEFNPSHLDSEVRRPDIDGRRSNDWLEPHVQLQKREQPFDEDNSKRVLMELLHQSSSHQSSQAKNLYEGEMLERRAPSGLFSGSSSSDHLFNFAQDRDSALNDSAFAPFANIAGQKNQFRLADEQAGGLNGSGMLSGGSSSENFVDGESLFPGMSQTSSLMFTNSNVSGKSIVDRDFADVDVKKRVPKVEEIMKGSVVDVSESLSKQPGLSPFENREIPVSSISRQSSIGITGPHTAFYNETLGHSDSFADDIAHERMPTVLSRASENVLLKRPPVPRPLSSQEGLSDRAIDAPAKVMNTSIVSPDGVRRDVGSNVLQSNTTSTKKDMRFRRTNSCSDADVSETSFIDMLKSNTRKPLQPEAHAESGDASQGAKGGKKKKKGRQIDPALLGFKVTSNRIMMGEIQRVED